MTNLEESLDKKVSDHNNGKMVQVVVFELDHEEYAVPILEVREVIRLTEITPVPQSQQFIVGVINLRGKIVPVLDLEKKFNLTREATFPSQHIIITESSNGILFGVMVDKVAEVLKVLEETIKPAPTLVKSKISAEYLNGVIVFTNDRILLLLDLSKILDEQQLREVQIATTVTIDKQQENNQI